MDFHSLTVAKVHQETRDTIVVTFDIPEAQRERFQFVQGQHLTLRAMLDGEELRRSYSICSGVDDGSLRVAIKRVSGGQFSTWANKSLKPGHVVDVMPPMGRFNLPIDPALERRYLAVAAGSGITPLMSIMRTTLAREPKSSFTLIYGNRSSSSVIFREELADLEDLYGDRLSIAHVMSREQQDVDIFNGRITKAKMTQLLDCWIDIQHHDAAFVCGPEQMMRDVSRALQEHGLDKELIKTELFAADANRREPRVVSPAVSDADASEITVLTNGARRTFSMAREQMSVLDAGLAQGINLRYSCKGGVCATCRCKVVEGKVEMSANYALEDGEMARGFVLSCQAFPITDKVVLDFDQDD